MARRWAGQPCSWHCLWAPLVYSACWWEGMDVGHCFSPPLLEDQVCSWRRALQLQSPVCSPCPPETPAPVLQGRQSLPQSCQAILEEELVCHPGHQAGHPALVQLSLEMKAHPPLPTPPLSLCILQAWHCMLLFQTDLMLCI